MMGDVRLIRAPFHASGLTILLLIRKALIWRKKKTVFCLSWSLEKHNMKLQISLMYQIFTQRREKTLLHDQKAKRETGSVT